MCFSFVIVKTRICTSNDRGQVFRSRHRDEVLVTRRYRNASSRYASTHRRASISIDRLVAGIPLTIPPSTDLARRLVSRSGVFQLLFGGCTAHSPFIRSQVSLTPAQPNLHSLWTSNRPAPRVERVLCHACRLLLQIRQGRSLPQHLQTILVLFLYLVEV